MRASTSEEARRSSATGDSYRLRHEQSERPVVLHRHGLTVYREGLAEAEPRRGRRRK